MIKSLIFLCSFFLTSLVTSVTDEEFDQYMRDYGKVYTPSERAARKEIFQANVAGFPNITDYTPGINKFTDWTAGETRGTPIFMQGLSGLQPLPESERKSSGDMPQRKLGAPASVDWRTGGILTSIKDQGGCGACWAFTSAGLAQSLLVQTGKQSTSINLSEQYLLQCTSDCTCAGGYIEYGLDRISKSCAQESQYAYIGPSLYGGSICSASGVDTKFKRSSYYDVTESQLINLLQYKPVAVAVSSTGWSSYSSGTITCNPSNPVDHAVIAVGYTADAWIIRNSWGTGWGLSGYALISRASGSNCQILSQVHVISPSNQLYRLFSLVLMLALMIMY